MFPFKMSLSILIPILNFICFCFQFHSKKLFKKIGIPKTIYRLKENIDMPSWDCRHILNFIKVFVFNWSAIVSIETRRKSNKMLWSKNFLLCNWIKKFKVFKQKRLEVFCYSHLSESKSEGWPWKVVWEAFLELSFQLLETQYHHPAQWCLSWGFWQHRLHQFLSALPTWLFQKILFQGASKSQNPEQLSHLFPSYCEEQSSPLGSIFLSVHQ